MPGRNPWKLATFALLTVLLGLILKTFGDYGMSWDEYYRNTEGTKKLVYYENALVGHWKPYDNPDDNYPGFYDLLHQVLFKTGLFGKGDLGLVFSDHFLTAIFGLLSIWAAYKMGERLAGSRAGFFSAFFLALFPHFYGHMFINPKDIPFACMYLWSLYYTLKIIMSPRLTLPFVGMVTLMYGLTLGVRLGGALFFGYLFVALMLRAWLYASQGQKLLLAFKYVGLVALIAFGAFLVLLPWWPFAQPNPLGAIYHTLTTLGQYPWNGPVVINGRVYPATHLPWFYMPEMLCVTTPVFMLVLSLQGLLGAAFALFNKKQVSRDVFSHRVSIGFVAFCFLFPIAVVAIKHATLYDGIRHFLFALGPWAVLLGLTLNSLFDYFRHVPQKTFQAFVIRLSLGATLLFCVWISLEQVCMWPIFYPGYFDPALTAAFIAAVAGLYGIARNSPTLGLACVALFCACLVARQDMALHPYQYVFFNSLVGGEEKAWNSFDTDYWGTSHREAVKLLSEHLKRLHDGKTYKVTSPMAPWLVEDFLPANLVYTTDMREADFFISFLRYHAEMLSDGDVMPDCIVARAGMPLAIVRDRRRILAQKNQQKGGLNKHIVSGIIDMLQPIF